MLRIISAFVLSLVFGYGIAQTQTLDVKEVLNTQYNLGPDGDKVMVVSYQRDMGAPVIVSWQSNDPKATLKSHSYTIAGAQSSRRVHFDLNSAPLADAAIFWLSTKNFDEITKGKTMIEMNGDKAQTPFVVKGKEDYNLLFNGKEMTVKAYRLESQDKDKSVSLLVLDNAKNPIVLKAEGLYNYELTDASSSD
ncbi:MAG TPA: hypothetical protein VEY71_07490 [Chitinophagales bacterium]|nr:hypothetical protein [Chitinophagales bacterium]